MADISALEPTTTSQSFTPFFHDPVALLSPKPISPLGVLDPLPAAVNRAHEIEVQAKAAADATKHRLAQEAFAADPDSMRKQFPTLLKDMEDNYPDEMFRGHLSTAQINSGIKNPNLSDADRDLLSVFKAGFSVLARDPGTNSGYDNRPKDDLEGISADTLALVDKAVNRNLDEDPYFRKHIVGEPIATAIVYGTLWAAATFVLTRDWRASASDGGLGAAVGFAVGAANSLMFEYDGSETKMYDQVKDDFLTFNSAFDKSLEANNNQRQDAPQ